VKEKIKTRIPVALFLSLNTWLILPRDPEIFGKVINVINLDQREDYVFIRSENKNITFDCIKGKFKKSQEVNNSTREFQGCHETNLSD
jgi:hypothetical protein